MERLRVFLEIDWCHPKDTDQKEIVLGLDMNKWLTWSTSVQKGPWGFSTFAPNILTVLFVLYKLLSPALSVAYIKQALWLLNDWILFQMGNSKIKRTIYYLLRPRKTLYHCEKRHYIFIKQKSFSTYFIKSLFLFLFRVAYITSNIQQYFFQQP